MLGFEMNLAAFDWMGDPRWIKGYPCAWSQLCLLCLSLKHPALIWITREIYVCVCSRWSHFLIEYHPKSSHRSDPWSVRQRSGTRLSHQRYYCQWRIWKSCPAGHHQKHHRHSNLSYSQENELACYCHHQCSGKHVRKIDAQPCFQKPPSSKIRCFN